MTAWIEEFVAHSGPRLAQNKLFLLRINIARFNTRKYIKKYFGARYFLKVLNFLFSFYFPFLKTIEFSLFLKNLEKKCGVRSPESRVQSRVQSRFYTMPYFGNVNNHRDEIRHDTFRCWQKCCNFHNPTCDNALRVSSKSGQIIAKFAYILLSRIKYDYFDTCKSFLWL